MEPFKRRGVKAVGGNGTYEGRLSALENRMITVEKNLGAAVTNAALAAQNTTEILGIINATKGAAAFLKKHGPRIVAFGFGIASAFGFSNPKLEQVFSSFF